jgi:signal transduction histidine kinase/ligand-binding sensor domain-containing protein/DNA-binding response OmpR family regulator
MFRSLSLILCIITSLLSLKVSGQNIVAVNPFPENNFVSISVKQGLSQSTVFNILKDSRGFMWFGTRTGGLNKYNGYEFQVFKNEYDDPNSLANNEVISLFEDSDGRIWIGTRNGGLNYFEPENETIHRVFLPRSGDESFTTTAIFQNKPENIWIGTNKGLFSYNLLTDSMQLVLDADVTGSISSIATLGNENLVIASTEKLIVFDTETLHLSNYDFSPEMVALAPNDKFTPVMVDLKDNIWVGSAEGLLTLTLDEKRTLIKKKPFKHIPNQLSSDIRAIKNDKNGNIWFGTFQGLVKYNARSDSFTIFHSDETNSLSISHNSVYSILNDETNSLWLGTWGGGVNMMSGLLRKFEHFSHQINNPKSLSDNIVSSFAEDKNGIWIGTEQGGLNFFDKETSSFRYHPINALGPNSKASDHIKALLLDHENNLWIGTFGNGLLLYNRKQNIFRHFLGDSKIYSISQTPDRNIWVGTQTGLYKLGSQGNELDYYRYQSDDNTSLSDDMVTSMLVDDNGEIWIGTKNGGLNLYNKHGNNFKRFMYSAGNAETISSNYIFSLCNGDAQTLWVGTSHGLNKLNKHNGSVSRINERINFPDKVINGILLDEEQNLWISTNKGILHYYEDEGLFTPYDYSDGLQSNEFNRGSYFRSADGKLYFGGINGFNSFYPSQIEKNPHIPQLQFTDLKLFYKSVKPNAPLSPLDKSVSQTEEITLSHSQSAFSIDFVALNYILPEKNQYAYFMEGYDSDWIYVGNTRSASYMNLGPGKYTFHVKASNNDNVWNEEGISLNIVVLPPFWKTPWAFAILGILFFMLLLLVRTIMITRIKQQNQIEFQRREVKRIEEINNMKLRFFTDISHEFKTPLTLIASPVEKLKKFAHLDAEFGYLTTIASKNVNRMKRLVEQLMTFRKIDKDTLKVAVAEYDMDQFLREIIDDFSEMAQNKQIRLRFHSQNITAGRQWFDKNFLDKIVFNLLSNAFKYTRKGGDISMFLSIEKEFAYITITDTGIGIAPEMLQKVFERFYSTDNHEMISSSGTGIGLALTKSLVELHHGNIEVKSILEKGSTFKVALPVDKKFYKAEEISPKAQLLSSDLAAELHEAVPVKSETEAVQSLSKEKIILIVEDNDDMKNYLVFNFGEFNTISAENGRDALDITQNIIPDLIISDVMMPVMNGIELLRHIRESHVTSHIPFILLSAKTEVADKIEGIESGADIYISKPFDLDYLKVTVNNLLELRKNLKELYSGNLLSEPDNKDIPPLHKKFLEKAAKIILANVSNENFSINELGDELILSRSQLFRKFKTICDISPAEFIRNERLKYAYELLKEGEMNVNEVAYQSGFSSASYFITSFKKKYGKTPNEAIKQA